MRFYFLNFLRAGFVASLSSSLEVSVSVELESSIVVSSELEEQMVLTLLLRLRLLLVVLKSPIKVSQFHSAESSEALSDEVQSFSRICEHSGVLGLQLSCLVTSCVLVMGSSFFGSLKNAGELFDRVILSVAASFAWSFSLELSMTTMRKIRQNKKQLKKSSVRIKGFSCP